jgi:tripartite-type tricarboxylate transporter receptor subunit TctC
MSIVRALIATIAASTLSLGSGALAQGYPSKPVRYLVPMSAGSGADTLGRIAAAALAQELRQQVVVDNRTGAAGNIGAELAAKAPPDGYTLFQASTTLTANVSLYKNLRYDLTRDFRPVTLLVISPSGVVVHPSLPARNMQELVKLAKSRPGAINYASTGVGSATFLNAELFKSLAGIDLQHVPYRGGGEALASVVTGETSVYFVTLAPSLPLVREGRLRLLAVSTAERVPTLPQYPTVAESGYPGFTAANWFGILVPAKTPAEVIDMVRSAAASALKRPEVVKRMHDLVYIPAAGSSEDFARFIRDDIERWRKIIREKGITAE